MVARIPAAGVDAFQRYEAEVLPILAEHGAELERRLRSADGCTEVHVIGFRQPPRSWPTATTSGAARSRSFSTRRAPRSSSTSCTTCECRYAASAARVTGATRFLPSRLAA